MARLRPLAEAETAAGAEHRRRRGYHAPVVYYDQSPRDEERPPGCLDALVITRAVFSILLWPLVALIVAILDVGAIIYLFTLNPLLALIPVGLTVVGVWLFARWEQQRFRPPDL